MSSGFGVAELGVMIPIIALLGAFLVAIVGVIAKSCRRSAETKAYEQSRREIAAYVAEGSMTPEDGARLLAEGRKPKSNA